MICVSYAKPVFDEIDFVYNIFYMTFQGLKQHFFKSNFLTVITIAMATK